MAYCVHCGVKLEAGVQRCPLCGTQVIDPAEENAAPVQRAYPVRSPEQELKRNKWFLFTWAAVLLLVPATLCLIIDWLTGGGIAWSIYAAGALILLFLSAACPLLLPPGHRLFPSIAVSFLCLNGYLFMTEQLSHSGGWFLPIVLPALTLGTLMLTVICALYRRDRLNKLTLTAALLLAVAAQCLAVEYLRSRTVSKSLTFLWSPYVVAPLVFISLVLFFINANRPMREELRRRVHF